MPRNTTEMHVLPTLVRKKMSLYLKQQFHHCFMNYCKERKKYLVHLDQLIMYPSWPSHLVL